MFSLKISKKVKEFLTVSVMETSSGLTAALFLFYTIHMFPRFSGTASVVPATLFFVGILSLLTLIIAYFLQKAPFWGKSATNIVFILLSLFFIPFFLEGKGGASSVFFETQKVLFFSAFFPLLTTLYPFFAVSLGAKNTPKSVLQGAVSLFVGGMIFAGVDNFAGEKTQQIFLITVWACLQVSYLFCLWNERNSPKNENVVVFDKSGLSVSLLRTYYCLIPIAFMLAISFRFMTRTMPFFESYFVPLAIVSACLALSFSSEKFFIRKTAIFLQPFAVVLLLILFFFDYDGIWMYPWLVSLTVISLCSFSFLADTVQTGSPTACFSACFSGIVVACLAVLFLSLLSGYHMEIPLLIVLFATVRSGMFFKGRTAFEIWRDFAVPLALFFVCFCVYFMWAREIDVYRHIFEALIFVAVGSICFLKVRPLLYGLTAGVLMLFGSYVFSVRDPISAFNKNTMTYTNFFGKTTINYFSREHTFSLFMENRPVGSRLNQEGVPQISLPISPASMFFKEGRKRIFSPQVAVIGMSMGEVALLAQSVYENWTYFDPDKDNVALATGMNGAFSYYAKHTPHSLTIVGEPLSEMKKTQKRYDMVYLDLRTFKTFPMYLLSSDSLKYFKEHLLTSDSLMLIGYPRYLEPKIKFFERLSKERFRYVMYTGNFEPDMFWLLISPNMKTIQDIAKENPSWR